MKIGIEEEDLVEDEVEWKEDIGEVKVVKKIDIKSREMEVRLEKKKEEVGKMKVIKGMKEEKKEDGSEVERKWKILGKIMIDEWERMIEIEERVKRIDKNIEESKRESVEWKGWRLRKDDVGRNRRDCEKNWEGWKKWGFNKSKF